MFSRPGRLGYWCGVFCCSCMSSGSCGDGYIIWLRWFPCLLCGSSVCRVVIVEIFLRSLVVIMEMFLRSLVVIVEIFLRSLVVIVEIFLRRTGYIWVSNLGPKEDWLYLGPQSWKLKVASKIFVTTHLIGLNMDWHCVVSSLKSSTATKFNCIYSCNSHKPMFVYIDLSSKTWHRVHMYLYGPIS